MGRYQKKKKISEFSKMSMDGFGILLIVLLKVEVHLSLKLPKTVLHFGLNKDIVTTFKLYFY